MQLDNYYMIPEVVTRITTNVHSTSDSINTVIQAI